MLDAWRRGDAWSREIDLDSGNSRSARPLQPETKRSQDFFFFTVKYVITLNITASLGGWGGCRSDQQ